MPKSRITDFADYSDLVTYIRCLEAGGHPATCLDKGDNGVGASGMVTAQTHTAMCALPHDDIVARWGVPGKGWGKKVLVEMRGKSVVCLLADIAPHGICDLNPAALIALQEQHPLGDAGEWFWVGDSSK